MKKIAFTPPPKTVSKTLPPYFAVTTYQNGPTDVLLVKKTPTHDLIPDLPDGWLVRIPFDRNWDQFNSKKGWPNYMSEKNYWALTWNPELYEEYVKVKGAKRPVRVENKFRNDCFAFAERVALKDLSYGDELVGGEDLVFAVAGANLDKMRDLFELQKIYPELPENTWSDGGLVYFGQDEIVNKLVPQIVPKEYKGRNVKPKVGEAYLGVKTAFSKKIACPYHAETVIAKKTTEGKEYRVVMYANAGKKMDHPEFSVYDRDYGYMDAWADYYQEFLLGVPIYKKFTHIPAPRSPAKKGKKPDKRAISKPIAKRLFKKKN